MHYIFFLLPYHILHHLLSYKSKDTQFLPVIVWKTATLCQICSNKAARNHFLHSAELGQHIVHVWLRVCLRRLYQQKFLISHFFISSPQIKSKPLAFIIICTATNILIPIFFSKAIALCKASLHFVFTFLDDCSRRRKRLVNCHNIIHAKGAQVKENSICFFIVRLTPVNFG